MDVPSGEEYVVLRPGFTKWLLILLGSGAFVAGGLAMILVGGPVTSAPLGDARFWGWIVVVFFGFGLLVSVAELVSPNLRLSLSPQGFTFGTFLGRRSVDWSAVSSFHSRVMATRSWPFGPMKLVRYNFTPAYGERTRRTGGFLPDTYGMSADALAEELSRWHHRYGSSER